MNTQGAKLLLYVEDNLDHADLVLHSLSRQNPATRVVHVEDGEAALDYLRRSEAGADPRPWLILLDLKLPRMDGFEVLRAVKASPELLDIPVVVLTTSSSDADIERAYQSHVNSYLVKPVDFPAMDQLIRALEHYWLANNTLPAVGH